MSTCLIVTPTGSTGTAFGLGDDDRLQLLGHEAGREQAVRQIGWQVVAAGLPLEGLAAGSEEVAVLRDQGVERRAGRTHVASGLDEPLVPSQDPQNRARQFVTDARGPVVRNPEPKLCVVGVTERVTGCHRG
ncbi:hypothetical protein [Cryobacterium sp. M25]|uniref:hypothetical protein n=1 Tax=Cryobacterium sp. M25 TaxID=2048293 RepID=UPI0018EA6B95|nr:hypothetical protein [Cryobacterium sp. M25]